MLMSVSVDVNGQILLIKKTKNLTSGLIINWHLQVLYIYKCKCVRVGAYMHAHRHTHMHTHRHTHTQSYTHAHTHTTIGTVP